MSDEMPKVAFLFGAGAVVDAGLPTAVGLTRRFRDYLTQKAREDGDVDHQKWLSVYNFLVGGIRFQAGVLDRDPDADVDIETLATAALRLQRRLESPLAPYTHGWHPRLTELESDHADALARFLEMMYARLTHWLNPQTPENLSYLAHIKSFCDEPYNVDLFSLNYDLCLEIALKDIAQIEFENGFTPSGWNSAGLSDDTKLRLVKLHGSLDWIDDPAWGICSLNVPEHTNADDIRGSGPPLLIFGTDTKMTAKDPYLTLLHLFSARLNETDVLAIVGYSLGDEYLNEVIEQRLISNPRLRLVFVSPSADQTIQATPFLRENPKVVTLSATAKEAFEQMALLREVRKLVELVQEEMPFQ